MSDNTVLEGLALRRAVAEALGWRMEWHTDEDAPSDGLYWDQTGWYLFSPTEYEGVYPKKHYMTIEDAWEWALHIIGMIPEYDTDLNTLREAAALLPEAVCVDLHIYRGQCLVRIEPGIMVNHAEPAAAAWNAVLRWLARKQEVGNESVK